MSDWMKQLHLIDKETSKTDRDYDPFDSKNVLRTASPSVNYIFGKGCGLPRGWKALLYGEPKSGKSLIANLFISHLHQTDPTAFAIKFDTEMRDQVQVGDFWGIDKSRYKAFLCNEPHLIFDRIVNEINKLVQAGLPLKLLIIDSFQGIQGVKESNRESINNHLMGDHSKTIQDGLKMILPVLSRNKISLLGVEHVRANFDAGQYGPKTKMAGGWAEKHYFEYYINVARDNSKEGKQDILGRAFEGTATDLKGKKDKTGHKIYVKMVDSSTGINGRSGKFTLDFTRGLINTEEEIFELSKNLGIVQRPNNRTYIFNGVKYNSKEEYLTAIIDNPELKQTLLEIIYEKAQSPIVETCNNMDNNNDNEDLLLKEVSVSDE